MPSERELIDDVATRIARIGKRLLSRATVVSYCFPGRRAVLWFIALVLIELLVPVARGSTFLTNEGLQWYAKAGLVALLICSCAAFVWWTVWYFYLVQLADRQLKNRAVRMVIQLAASATFAIVMTLYFASWVIFWRLGNFPGFDVISFAMINLKMLGHYFWQTERTDFLMAISGISVIFTATTVQGWSWFHRCEMKRPPWFAGVLITWFAVSGSLFAVLTADSLLEPTLKSKPWPRLHSEVQFRASPALSLLADLAAESDVDVTGDIPTTALIPIGIKQASSAAPTDEQRRSIILIVVESLRSDAVRAIHQDLEVMPNVQQLVRTGCFFPNLYSQSVHSDYSDPCIVSSLYPLRKPRQMYYRSNDPWPKTLIFDVFKNAGYSTAMFSSQNETWGNMNMFYADAKLDILYDSRSYGGPTYARKGNFKHWMEETGQVAGKLDDAVTAAEAIKWMSSQHQSGKSFIVSINFQTSHFPYEIPGGRTGPFQPCNTDFQKSLIRYDKDKAPILKNAYFNALRYIDSQIGSIVQFLEKSGHRDDTIIMITGDHGEAFHENGEVGHGKSPLETVLKVGLVLNCPGVIEPKVDEYLAQAIDIAPTAGTLVGLEPHPSYQGIDLVDQQRPAVENRVVFIHCKTAIASRDAVISGTGWKYIIDRRIERPSLYYRPTDLEKHPNRLKSCPHVAKRLDQLLSEWRRRQLLYYDQPRYYSWFYAPHEPQITLDDLSVLKRAADALDAEAQIPNTPREPHITGDSVLTRSDDKFEAEVCN